MCHLAFCCKMPEKGVEKPEKSVGNFWDKYCIFCCSVLYFIVESKEIR